MIGSEQDPGPSLPQSGILGSFQAASSTGAPEDPWEDVSEDDSGTKANADDTVSTPDFHNMMSYSVRFFPEALGHAEKAHHPSPPGKVRPVEDKHIQFTIGTA